MTLHEHDRVPTDIELAQRLAEQLRRYQALSEEHAAIEQQNTTLASLYVASYRLHEATTWTATVAVIQEIVINLIGSEQVGIFALPPDRSELRLLGAFGLCEDTYAAVPFAASLMRRAVANATTFVPTRAELDAALPSERKLTACIPLVGRGRVLGVVAIHELLAHKRALAPVDFELFELLAAHGGSALHCCDLHGPQAPAADTSASAEQAP